LKVKVLWGTRIGAEDWQEELITDRQEDIETAKIWAENNGFDRLRISTVDLSVPPDFTKTINIL